CWRTSRRIGTGANMELRCAGMSIKPITMRKRTATLFFWGLVLACGSEAAQQGPGLVARNPIRLTNVEGRMDHLGVDVKGQRLFPTACDNRTPEVIDLKTGRKIR